MRFCRVLSRDLGKLWVFSCVLNQCVLGFLWSFCKIPLEVDLVGFGVESKAIGKSLEIPTQTTWNPGENR